MPVVEPLLVPTVPVPVSPAPPCPDPGEAVEPDEAAVPSVPIAPGAEFVVPWMPDGDGSDSLAAPAPSAIVCGSSDDEHAPLRVEMLSITHGASHERRRASPRALARACCRPRSARVDRYERRY